MSTGVGIVASTTNGARDARDLRVDLRPVDEHLLRRRLVVRDRLQRHVRDDPADLLAFLVLLALVREAAGRAARRILELVIRERRRQQPLTRERERHARRIDRDPPPTPLLSDVRSRAGAAGRVEHQVARVGGHQKAALDDLRSRLHHVHLFRTRSSGCVSPNVSDRLHREVRRQAPVAEDRTHRMNTTCGYQPLHPVFGHLPVIAHLRSVRPPLVDNFVRTSGSDALRLEIAKCDPVIVS